MTSTTIVTPKLAEGVSYSESTRLVAEAHPGLIEAMERAGQEFYEKEDGWQEEVATHQRAAGLPQRSIESPYGQALRQAAVAVTDKFDELLASGQIEAKN